MEFTVALITHTNRLVVAQVTEGHAPLSAVIAKYSTTCSAVVLWGREGGGGDLEKHEMTTIEPYP